MTDEEINKAIAEVCGICHSGEHGPLYKTNAGWVHDCPDYCNDLNAIAEAERHLTEDQLEAMNTRIWAAMMNTDYIWQVSARQRAMALIEAVYPS
jgi:hypothetical protein